MGTMFGVIPPVHDYFISYSKNSSLLNDANFGMPLTKDFIDKNFKNPDNDPRGVWTTMDLSANHEGPYFPIENKETGEIYYPSKGRYWVFNEKEVEKRIKDGKIIFGKTGKSSPVFSTVHFLNQAKAS
ncbi:hypothetical protein [Crenothrix polyspora]|uniref:Uncharacterized protein n=1 Tax=Crenothrix polyspora TaxID=360316 RepID=A0A1R4H0P1_9GAMM|nr:hypothetical protein [Crenothrix polyspora]SJM89772.1 hypothetical protein CRENPOLYSF1_1200002 [Crenothrix polyspora]